MLANTLQVASGVVKLGMDYNLSTGHPNDGPGRQGDRNGREPIARHVTKKVRSFRTSGHRYAFGEQLGIAKNEIADFTKTTAQLKATTDLTLDSAGQTAMFKRRSARCRQRLRQRPSSKVGVTTRPQQQIANVSTDRVDGAARRI